MKNLTVETLMNSEYDADTNRIYLDFEDGNNKWVAYDEAPEKQFDDESYFDNQENIYKFLKDAIIEEK